MLTHGGDIFGFARRYGAEPLDFSVNVNLFGMPPGAKAALERAATRAGQYPDPLYRRLRQAIGAHEGVPMDQVVCGNGAADLIWRVVLARKPRRALVTAPTFSEYESALRWAGCQVERHALDPRRGFQLGEEVLEDIRPGTEMVFLCNPNNPVGQVVGKELAEKILDRCQARGALLVVDECFLDFLPDAGELTLKGRLADGPGLLILKALTKLYAMAGLRLGYGLSSDRALLEGIRGAGQCWPVSIAAEEAGIAALEDRAFTRKIVELLPKERERMRGSMAGLGLEVFPSQANFLLFHTRIPGYGERLARQGILVRDCGNYPGLGEGYYRVAILTPEKNDRLLAAMETIGRELE